MTVIKNFLKLTFLLALIVSCTEEEQIVSINKEFKVGESSITITKFESSKGMRNKDKTELKLAPKGKKMIHFEVKNPDDKMVFLHAFSNGSELESENGLTYFSHDLGTEYIDKYFFVDENATIDKISLTTPGGESYAVMTPSLSNNTSLVINPIVEKLVASYSKEKAAPLVEAFNPYVKEGVNVYDIAFQKGQVIASNIQSNNAKITNISEDGSVYTLRVDNVLGGYAKLTTTWENDKVTKIIVKEY